ncbi:MAG: hypothetical protein FWF57_00725 [Defluviitaleaceae bacterium]|nr:hypothetical protein [Defluviitaleaceae bacterium]
MVDFIGFINMHIYQPEECKMKLYEEFYKSFKRGLVKPLLKDKTIPYIDEYMKKELLAEEFMDITFNNINKDKYIRTEEIVKMYRVNNSNVLKNLRTWMEKIHYIPGIEEILRTEQKDYLFLFLGSKDGINVSGYTITGLSEKFKAIVNVLLSTPPKPDEIFDLNDEVDTHYLTSLFLAGYLDVS